MTWEEEWDSILKNPNFQTEPQDVKKKVASSFFTEGLLRRPDFLKQVSSQSEQNLVLYGLMKSIGPQQQITPEKAGVDVIAGAVPLDSRLQPEPWETTIKEATKNIPRAAMGSISGIKQFIGEQGLKFREGQENIPAEEMQFFRTLAEQGAAERKGIEEVSAPKQPISIEQQMVRGAGTTLGVMAPGVTAGVGGLGVKAITAFSSAPMFGLQYGEGRAAGESTNKAFVDATFETAIEYLGNIIPITKWADASKTPLARFWGGLATAEITEPLEEVTQDIKTSILRTGEFPKVEDLKRTTIATLIQTPIISAISGGLISSVASLNTKDKFRIAGDIQENSKQNPGKPLEEIILNTLKNERGLWGPPPEATSEEDLVEKLKNTGAFVVYPNKKIVDKIRAAKGPEALIRVPISDANSRIKTLTLSPSPNTAIKYSLPEQGRLPDFIEHPLIFELVPELKNVSIHITHIPPNKGGQARGQLDVITDIKGRPSFFLTFDDALQTGEMKESLIHEIQHIINRLQGWPLGSAPNLTASKEEWNTLQSKVNKILTKYPDIMERPDHLNDQLIRYYSQQDKIYHKAYVLYQATLGEMDSRYNAEVSSLSKIDLAGRQPYTSKTTITIPKDLIHLRADEEAQMEATEEPKPAITAPFYSQLEKTFKEKIHTEKPVNPEAFEQLLKYAKADEVTNTQIKDFLEGKKAIKEKVSKNDVLDYLKEQRIEFEDVIYGSLSDETPKGIVKEYTHFSAYQEPGSVLGSYREMFVTAPGAVEQNVNPYTGNWQDGHPQYKDVKNPVIRIRFNERTDDAGRKILFIEEMQGPSKYNQTKMPEWLRKRQYDVGVKRILKYAADNGFDGVSWTSGEMQANRYALSKHIDKLEVEELGNGNYAIFGYKNGKQILGDDSSKEKLAETIGKERAEKVFKGQIVFEEPDLKVGGEGLKSLYDKILPKKFQEITKGKVGETRIIKEKGPTIAGVPIESEMIVSFISVPKALAFEGFPMYSQEAPKSQIPQELIYQVLGVLDTTPEQIQDDIKFYTERPEVYAKGDIIHAIIEDKITNPINTAILFSKKMSKPNLTPEQLQTYATKGVEEKARAMKAISALAKLNHPYVNQLLNEQLNLLKKGLQSPDVIDTEASFSVASLAEKVFETHTKTGGSTFNPRTQENLIGKKGFAVSIYPEKEVIKPSVIALDIERYVAKNQQTFTEDPQAMLGTWLNKETGDTYLDIIRVVPTKKAAITLAQQHGQLAIFDLQALKEIRVEDEAAKALEKRVRIATNNLPPEDLIKRLLSETQNFDAKSLLAKGLKAADLATLTPYRVADEFEGYKENGIQKEFIFKQAMAEIESEYTAHQQFLQFLKDLTAIKPEWSTEEYNRVIVKALDIMKADTQRDALIKELNMTDIPVLSKDETALLDLLEKTSTQNVEDVAKVFEAREGEPFKRIPHYYFALKYKGQKNIVDGNLLRQDYHTTKQAKDYFTQARKRGVEQIIRTDLITMMREQLQEKNWYIHMQPILDTQAAVLFTPEFKEKAGDIVYHWWKNQIDIVARRGYSAKSDSLFPEFDDMLKAGRVNLTKAVLTYKAISAAAQIFSTGDAMMLALTSNKKAAALKMIPNVLKAWFTIKRPAIYKASKALQMREGGEQSLIEAFEKPVMSKVARAGYFLLKEFDLRTAMGVQKTFFDTFQGKTTDPLKEAELYTILSQGGGGVVFRPHILATGEVAKTALTLQTFFLNRWGLVSHDIFKKSIIHGSAKQKALGGAALALLIAFAIGEDALREAISQQINKKPPFKKIPLHKKILSVLPEQIPLFGRVLSNMIQDRPQGLSEVPLLRAVYKGIQGIKNTIAQDEWQAKLQAAMQSLETVLTLMGFIGTSQVFDILERYYPETKGQLKKRISYLKKELEKADETGDEATFERVSAELERLLNVLEERKIEEEPSEIQE